ncbi:HTH-type transcriptional activator CmpR [compost metagenome]
MNLDRLTTFLAAAEDLNFTQAARRLHLSQPAVSQQIRDMEEELGVTLFERRGRGILLTPAGERLRALARPVLKDVKQLQVEMGVFRDVPQGVLRVGASNTPGIYLLPFAMGAFSESFPAVRLSMQVSDTEMIMRALNDGELDLALVEEEPSPARLHGWEKVPLLEDELVMIAHPRHPWVSRETLDVKELPEGTFIFRTPQSETRRLIEDRLAEAGLDTERLTTRFELGHTEGLKRAVMAGLGVGWVSRFAMGMEARAGHLAEVPIRDFRITRTLWLVRPAGGRLAPHLERFSTLLHEGGWLPQEVGTQGVRA